MSTEDKKGSRRKNGRARARRRKELEDDQEVDLQGLRKFWERGGKQFALSTIFGFAIIFICFVGQDPPGLRTLGEVAPENIYSGRTFKYLSEVRRQEAEEWIRSSTPREFSRDFAGEEGFNKALIRLEEGLSALDSMTREAREVAKISLIEELSTNFLFKLNVDEFKCSFALETFSPTKEFLFNNQAFTGKTSSRGCR